MQVVLTQDVPNLGKAGQLKEVDESYARDYLLPNGYAVSTTTDGVSQAQVKPAGKLCDDADSIAQVLNGRTIYFTLCTDTSDRRYDLITREDIADQIQQQFGLNIARHMLRLSQPIRRVGVYYLPVHSAGSVIAWLNLVVHQVPTAGMEDVGSAFVLNAGEQPPPDSEVQL